MIIIILPPRPITTTIMMMYVLLFLKYYYYYYHCFYYYLLLFCCYYSDYYNYYYIIVIIIITCIIKCVIISMKLLNIINVGNIQEYAACRAATNMKMTTTLQRGALSGSLPRVQLELRAAKCNINAVNMV